MRLIIAGSRSFNDYELLKLEVFKFYCSIHMEGADECEIVSGGANGADKLGERYAEQYKIPVKRFPADWGKLGKSAGFHRNRHMAMYATHCICFWDGQSKGTKMMIDLAVKHGLVLKVVSLIQTESI